MDKQEEANVVVPHSDNYAAIQHDEIYIHDLWKVIVKRKIIIITLFIISLLGATVYSFTAPQIYRLETHLKLYVPNDVLTANELPTAKEVSSLIGKINDEKTAIIFLKNANEITKAEVGELRGTTDKFKITIESRSRDILPAALQEMIAYIENIRMIKSKYEKIISEMDERIKFLKDAEKKSDLYIKDFEKIRNNARSFPVTLDPVSSIIKSIDLKMEKYLLEQERQNFKLIQFLDDPFISKYPVKPAKAMITTIAGICGIMFGIVIAFIAEYVEGLHKKKRN